MNNFKSLLIILVLINPFLIYYEILNVTISSFISLLVLILLIILTLNNNINRKLTKASIFLIIFLFLITILQLLIFSYFKWDSSINTSIVLFANLTSFVLLHNATMTRVNFIKYYRFVVLLLAALVIIQYVAFVVFGFQIVMKIPFLTTLDEYSNTFGNAFSIYSNKYQFRASGVFTEPAHYAQYILPFFIINFYNNREQKFLTYILVISLIVSFSGLGIVLLVGNFLYRLFSNKKYSIFRYIHLLIFLLLFAGLILYVPFLREYFDLLFIGNMNYTSKAYYRIYRGFELFIDLPILNKLLGVGYKNALAATTYFGLDNKYTYTNTIFEYFNTISQIMIYFGLIGFYFTVKYFLKLLSTLNITGRVITFNFILICLASSVFFDATWIFYVSIILLFKRVEI